MDKKKWGFFVVCLGIIALIIALWVNMAKKDEPTNAPADTNTPASETPVNQTEGDGEEHGLDEHAAYVQDEDKDPFIGLDEPEGVLLLDDLPFEYELLTETSFPKTAATLIDANEHYLLYRLYNDNMSYYNLKTGEKKYADTSINQALVTPDGAFIVYTKNAILKEGFYYMDLATLQNSEYDLYAQETRMKVIDIAFHNGVVYYIVEDDATKKTSIHYSVLPSYAGKSTNAYLDAALPLDTDKLYNLNNGVYAFDKKSNRIVEIGVGKAGKTLIDLSSHNVASVRSVDYASETNWVVTLQTKDGQHQVVTANETLTSFEGAMDAYLFGDEHLVVNDNLSLYLYNTTNQEETVVKAGISYVFPHENTLTIQLNDGNILKMKRQ